MHHKSEHWLRTVKPAMHGALVPSGTVTVPRTALLSHCHRLYRSRVQATRLFPGLPATSATVSACYETRVGQLDVTRRATLGWSCVPTAGIPRVRGSAKFGTRREGGPRGVPSRGPLHAIGDRGGGGVVRRILVFGGAILVSALALYLIVVICFDLSGKFFQG